MSQFRNLVFEGGGVKGIAYAGALSELEAQAIMPDIRRVAGTSAGAITAVLVALGATAKDVEDIVGGTNFNEFMDGPWGVIGDAGRVVNDYGVYAGDAFANWMKKQIYTFSGDPNLTFRQMAAMKQSRPSFRDLYLVGTNLSLQLPLVLSVEHTPDCALWYAARISMSIPLFFIAVRDAEDKQIWVDGGVTWNYPIDLFDDKKFNPASNAFVIPDYSRYDENTVYNKETLGFRLDTRDQIQAEKDHWKSPPFPILNLLDYAKALIGFMNDMANRLHLHQNDWHRTIFIETGSIGTTQFDLSSADIQMLVRNGQTGVQDYFKWFNDPTAQPLNRV
jgi:NTE family protein